MATDPTDWELIEGVRARDRAAMAALYDRYARSVYSVALAVVRDPRGAEDVVQDAFLTIWRRPDTYQPDRGAFGPWILRVARNRAIDLVRRRAHERHEPDDELLGFAERLVDPDPSPDEQIWSRAVAVRVRAALGDLTDVQREVIELAYFGGLTQSEMAARLDIPLGTVKTRVRTALRRLAQILEDAEVWTDLP
ncbi:MAG TPA: sigma-70 family RNA polymerase sigma factor [Thermomicrobiaceae bacterium]|nr:sigma-70 family RNA polymerase sigma factor [Thermomicrobiaceae bacterium]